MNKARREGFTLAEVLVTIAIVATLAAVLLPALFGQLSKGDASRTSSDLLAMRTAIGTFVSDARRYPDSLIHLTAPITGKKDINQKDYPSRLASRWEGPYLNKALASDGSMPTAFGASINADLVKSAASEYNGIPYVRIDISPITVEDFDALDLIIDETANSSSGQLQYVSSTSGTARFYAVPIQ